MATIGTFKKTGNEYTGEIVTRPDCLRTSLAGDLNPLRKVASRLICARFHHNLTQRWGSGHAVTLFGIAV